MWSIVRTGPVFRLAVRVRRRSVESKMAITIMCPNLRCRKILVVHNRYRGSKVRCSYCGTNLIVPWPKRVGQTAGVEVEEAEAEERKKR